MTEPRIPTSSSESSPPPAPAPAERGDGRGERAAPVRAPVGAVQEPALDDRIPATERILRATARGLVERGAASLSMQEVADSAGVSTGLIHDHYHDKAALLVRVITWMTEGLVAREAEALDDVEAATAVDTLWQWLDGEIRRGDIRAVLGLAYDPAPGVREAVREAAARRREVASHTVDALFAALGLRPRIPVPLLADVLVAFVDGLAFQATITPDADRRVAFDVFWLALLSLAE